MNVERILELARRLENLDPPRPDMGFDMRDYFMSRNGVVFYALSYGGLAWKPEECGTAGCIAGWTVAIWEPEEWREESFISGIAADILELSEEESRRLFTPSSGQYPDCYSAKPAQVARVLRHLAATGEVDWDQMIDPE